MSDAPLALDRLPRDAARTELARCCGAWRWVEGMLEQRPFGRREKVMEAAEQVWDTLGPGDWIEAFSHHPRIGESRAAAHDDAAARAWSAEEQARAVADDADRERLAAANATYEQRFGHIFIICAPGLTAAEILARLETRMHNDVETELRVAAEEQRRIMRLRLERLLER